jgi:hypothetical protein
MDGGLGIKKVMPKAPLLSVCIPAYNRPNWLRRGLESIAITEGTGIEIVITDDSDTNQSQAIATWLMVNIKNFGTISPDHNGFVCGKFLESGLMPSYGTLLPV